jgi:hypothetical protein
LVQLRAALISADAKSDDAFGAMTTKFFFLCEDGEEEFEPHRSEAACAALATATGWAKRFPFGV